MKPWNSGDAVEPGQHTYDQVRRPETQAEIDLCINCPLPEKRCAGNGGCYLRKTEDGKVVRRPRKQKGAFNPEVYHTLRTEFPALKSRLPTLWTNSYFVSTVGGAPLSAIKQYIENQKNV